MESQRLVAACYAANGWPFATDAGAGRAGRDILNIPGIANEVKGRSGFDPGAAMRQAEATANGDLAVVTLRLNGMGPANIMDWLQIMRFGSFLTLARQAGYGDPLPDGAAVPL